MAHRSRLVAVFFVALFALVSPAVAQDLAARLRQQIAEPTVFVEATVAGERVVFPDGSIVATNRWGSGPLKDGLALAINTIGAQQRGCTQRSVIGVRGSVTGVIVGGGAPAGTTGVAYWPNKQPINVDVVNSDDKATIRGLSISSSLGGIERLRVCGLTILGPPGSTSAVSGYMGGNTGRLCLWTCTIEGADRASWGGHGSKWPIRLHLHCNGVDGPTQAWTRYTGTLTQHGGDGKGGGVEVVNCTIQPGQEHAYLYADNLGPNSRITDIRAPDWYDRSLWVERTLVQVCNRANPAGVTAGGPSGYGSLEIARIESVQCGGDPAFGGNGDGSAITVAGHLGPVHVHDLNLSGYHGGGIVVWTDGNPVKGYWQFADGFTTGAVTIDNVTLASAINTNAHIAVGGARSVRIGTFSITGRGTALDVDNSFTGPVKSGAVVFDLGQLPSTYAGWQSQQRMRRNNVAVTPAQLDAMAVVEGTTKP